MVLSARRPKMCAPRDPNRGILDLAVFEECREGLARARRQTGLKSHRRAHRLVGLLLSSKFKSIVSTSAFGMVAKPRALAGTLRYSWVPVEPCFPIRIDMELLGGDLASSDFLAREPLGRDVVDEGRELRDRSIQTWRLLGFQQSVPAGPGSGVMW